MDRFDKLPYVLSAPLGLLTLFFGVALWAFSWGEFREKVSRFIEGDSEGW